MRKRVALGIAALASMGWAATSEAAWLHQKGNDDPFKGGAEHIVLASEFDGFAVAFRCTSRKDLTLMLIVPDKPEPDLLLLARRLPTRLLVIIDDGEKIDFDAELEATPDLSNIRLAATDENLKSIAYGVASARKRVAVAGEVNGEIVWSKSFRVNGSSRALNPLISGCALSE